MRGQKQGKKSKTFTHNGQCTTFFGGGFACSARFRAFANCAQSWPGAFCRPPYLLSQCKYQSLAPPLSCCELHSAFSSTRLASFRSCASFFLLRAAGHSRAAATDTPALHSAAACPRVVDALICHVSPPMVCLCLRASSYPFQPLWWWRLWTGAGFCFLNPLQVTYRD